MKTPIVLLLSSLALAGCSGVELSAADSGAPDAAKDSGSSDGGPIDSSSTDSSGDAGLTAIQIGNCQQLTPCGGDVVGTWAFAGGCVDDPLAQSKALCPALQVKSQTASGSGTVTFTASMVTRSYQTEYAMDVVVPTACLLNQTCGQIQASLAVYIPNAACTAVTGGCECTGSLTSAATQASPYTLSNNEIVTAADHWAYCITGSDMQYHHTSGPTTEVGTYHLIKQ